MSAADVGHRGPTVEVNVSDPRINANPWPYFEEWRNTAPAVYNTAINAWMVTGFNDVRKILVDEKHFDHDNDVFNAAFGGRHLATLRPPVHRAVREVFRHEFERQTLAQRWEEMVQEVVDEHIGDVITRLRAGETVDIVSEALQRISTWSILRMMGIDSSMDVDIDAKFRRWAEDMSGHANAATELDLSVAQELWARGEASREEAHVFAERLLTERGADSDAHDLIHDLAVSGMSAPVTDPTSPLYESAEPMLSRIDMRAQVANFVAAAQNNVVNSMAGAIVQLARFPDDRRQILDNIDLLSPFMEENFRYNTALMASPRVVVEGNGAVEVGGTTILEGERVYALNGAANRDPRRWVDPQTFDMHRDFLSSLTFGFGPHSCLGVNLARMEGRHILLALLERTPDFELTIDEIPYGTRFMSRGPKAVPIRLT